VETSEFNSEEEKVVEQEKEMTRLDWKDRQNLSDQND